MKPRAMKALGDPSDRSQPNFLSNPSHPVTPVILVNPVILVILIPMVIQVILITPVILVILVNPVTLVILGIPVILVTVASHPSHPSHPCHPCLTLFIPVTLVILGHFRKSELAG